MRQTIFLILLVSGFAVGVFGSTQTIAIDAAQPTHYFYTPTPYVNPPYSLILSLHEISFALPYNLQLQASLFDNIGRINVGAKYGILDNLSVGVGLAHTIAHIGRGNHGIASWARPRLGAFLTWGPIIGEPVELGITPHFQAGDRFSVGVDLGLKVKPVPMWAIIWEVGSSVDVSDNRLYLNTDGGIRISPPSLPFLNFDIGVDLEEFPVVEHTSPSATVYFDVIFGMVVK